MAINHVIRAYSGEAAKQGPKNLMNGRDSMGDDLVFPSEAGTVMGPDNIAPRYMEPALEKAGLRRFRFHDLRHIFGSLLIRDGASLA
jgi:integrase